MHQRSFPFFTDHGNGPSGLLILFQFLRNRIRFLPSLFLGDD